MALSWGTRTSAARDRDAPADELLLQACRDGDLEAFATLFRRYHQAVVQIAAATSRSFDPEDLAAEAFTRIWAAIRDGRGPTHSFLPYARTVVRNVAANWSRRSWESPTEPEQLERASSQSAGADTFEDALAEHQLVSEAFSTLPGRWQSVLWMTEVEGKRAAEVAAELQISPNAAAALSKRARSALGGAWLQAQVDTRGKDGECQWVLEHIGRHVRNSLTDQQRARVRDHLDACQECDRASRRIAHLGSSLRLVALLAGGTAAGLAAWTTSAATPAFAAGALPVPASGGPPGAGGATRNVVKQLARQALTTQGAIAVGVAAAAVAIAAVVVPGALSGKESLEAAGPAVGTVNRAPQPVVPPREPTVPDAREPEIEAEPSIQETEPADTASADEEVTLLVERSTTDRKPAPKDDNPKPTDPGERPEPTDPRPEPTDPRPEPTDPRPEPTDPRPEPTDPRPEPTDPRPEPTDPRPEPTDPRPSPTDPQPEPTDPRPEPTDPRPEPTDPWCPSWPDWPGWPGWQLNPDWQIVPGWPGWPIDPECPTQPTPAEPTEPIEPGEPDEPGEPTNPGEPSEPGEPSKPTDPTDPGEPGQPTEPVDPQPEPVDPPSELEEPQPQPVESPGPGDPEPPAERANAHTDNAAGIADVTAEVSAASSAHDPDSSRQRHAGPGAPSDGDLNAESSAEGMRDAG